MFDKENKGYLTKDEKAECIKTVSDKNFADKFMMGLETKGGIGDATNNEARFEDRVF